MTVEAIVTLNPLYIKSMLDYHSALQVFDKYWYEVSFYIFRAERRFRKRAFALIDNNNTPYVFVMAINRWLGIRLVSQLITVDKNHSKQTKEKYSLPRFYGVNFSIFLARNYRGYTYM